MQALLDLRPLRTFTVRDPRPLLVSLAAVALLLASMLAMGGCSGRPFQEGVGQGGDPGGSGTTVGGGGQGSGGVDGGFPIPEPDLGTAPPDVPRPQLDLPGGDDAGVCNGLDDTACKANPACELVQCPGCCGQIGSGCVPAGTYFGCPAVDCSGVRCAAPCTTRDEADCGQEQDCRADYCDACDGTGNQVFAGCSDASGPPTGCPERFACFEPMCDGLDRQACDASPVCHSVIRDDSQLCDCAAAGCCTEFVRCAPGKQADCTGPARCHQKEPYCSGPYVVSYTNQCYEGCVEATACRFACAGLDEGTCNSRPDCTAQYCAGGDTDVPRFFACNPANQVEPECPPIP
jgi:hypothetical protein